MPHAMRLLFVATQADYDLVFAEIEATSPLVYLKSEHFQGDVPPLWHRFADIPNRAIRPTGRTVDPMFEIAYAGTEVKVKLSNNQRDPTWNMAWLDPSVRGQLGGRFEDWAVISGHIQTYNDGGERARLLRRIKRVVSKHFTKRGSFWWGPEAVQLYEQGLKVQGHTKRMPE